MSDKPRVDMWYSLQSAYCYFLIDRLLRLSGAGVDVVIRPLLGLVLRDPVSMTRRTQIETEYFETDSHRTAAYLRLPFAEPDPSPIRFEPGPGWAACEEQPDVEMIYRLFTGACRAGQGLAFLDEVVRHLWNGSQPGWNESGFLNDALARIDLDRLLADNPWESVERELSENAEAIHAAGHWGVPMMLYNGEPFYGQDRFDQLLWRMGIDLD